MIHDNIVLPRIVTILFDIVGVYVGYHLIEQMFGINNVTVSLLLNSTNRENDYGSLVSYNVTSPSQVEIQTHEMTEFQLVIPYNIQVNVSITARLCGQYSIPIIVQLLFSKTLIQLKCDILTSIHYII